MLYFFMKMLLCVFIALGLVLGILLFYKFRYQILLEYKKEKMMYSMYFCLFKYKQILFTGELNPFTKNKQDAQGGQTNRRIFIKRIFKDLLLSNRITYENIFLKVIVGLEDVIISAYLYGFLSILFSCLPPILSIWFGVEKTSIQVKPIFRKNILQISFKCIVRMKIADIMIIILNKTRKRWWNRVGTSN